jgi:hypothetical protein
MSSLAITRQRAATWLRERFRIDGMSARDAARWGGCLDMADLGAMVIAWLNGEVAQTPGHCGPPCAETIPLIPVLTAVNRAGFVTDCSQLAETRSDGRSWNTWVSGFASDDTQARLCEATWRTPLDMDSCHAAAAVHGCQGKPWGGASCPAAECAGYWADACPFAAGALADVWWVYIEDPEPGRNDRLWPALEAFAGSAVQP